jgi:hypothetical protein
VASASSNELIVWDIKAGSLVKSVPSSSNRLFTDIMFSSDERTLVASDSSGALYEIPFNAPSTPTLTDVCAVLPGGAREFSAGQMRELAFLREFDKAPCGRPALLSFAHLHRWFNQILSTHATPKITH